MLQVACIGEKRGGFVEFARWIFDGQKSATVIHTYDIKVWNFMVCPDVENKFSN